MIVQGLDVSEYQGNIDWGIVKRAGVRFALLRAGYGAGTIDVQFRNNARGCEEEGIEFGVYWLSYAYTTEMAKREAEYCLETIEEYKSIATVCIAYTYDSMRYARSKGVDVTEDFVDSVIEAFCARTESLGYIASYYSQASSFFLPKKIR